MNHNTTIAIVTANLIPLFGIFAGDWSVSDLILLYWLENLVVGFYWLYKKAHGHIKAGSSVLSGIEDVGFFTLHYSIFCLVHGLFVFILFFPDLADTVDGFAVMFEEDNGLLNLPVMLWATLNHYVTAEILFALFFLAASHGFTSWRELSGAGPRRDGVIYETPYPRIVFLHLFILGAGFLFMEGVLPYYLLALFVVAKTIFDLLFEKGP
ncbi:MAG: hypothetical protein EA364_03330 [Balneolaceae bacterium]|nr:MAG: hypothetical protein EA364_03330 [Balneolaceae bacterium]